jgi:microcystin-dependent protein
MEPFLGGIYMMGFNFAPSGYAMCNGQLLSIAQNTALFALIGTFYGGNGANTFALPDLRGRVPVHQGQGSGLSSYTIGEVAGSENVTLITSQIPAHTHGIQAINAAGTTNLPAGAFLAQGPSTGSGPNATSLNTYTSSVSPVVDLNAGSITATGGSQPHSNLQPLLVVNFIIALQGIFPSRN